jgi:hypothetical protein
MKMNKILGILFSVSVIISLAVYATPGDPEWASQEGYSSSNESTNVELNVTAQGGNYTYMNVSAHEQTSNWQLFYGTLSSKLLLKDGNGNVAYTWGTGTVSNGYIFFANTTEIAWDSALEQAAEADMNTESSALGLTGTDNVTLTFTETTHPAIEFGATTTAISNSYTVTTSNQTNDNAWPTTVMRDTNTKLLYTGFFNNTNNVAFNGQPANYQVLLPTGTNPRTYYVYLALQ